MPYSGKDLKNNTRTRLQNRKALSISLALKLFEPRINLNACCHSPALSQAAIAEFRVMRFGAVLGMALRAIIAA